MMQQWRQQWQIYSDKYLQLSPREQYLIILTGLVAITFIIFHLFIDTKLLETNRLTQDLLQIENQSKTLTLSAKEYQAALAQDPNTAITAQIKQFEEKLAEVDTQLLTLTSQLISPTQMRQALLALLKLEKGVSLLSFELIGAQPLLDETNVSVTAQNLAEESIKPSSENSEGNNAISSMNLYRHGIKIKLSGRYFELRNYLSQLEQLSWKFFWQEFDLKVVEYPMSEVSIEIYSLGSKEAFVGV